MPARLRGSCRYDRPRGGVLQQERRHSTTGQASSTGPGILARLERNDSVCRKRSDIAAVALDKEPEQSVDVRHVANQHDVACLADKHVGDSLGVVSRLKTSSCRDSSERVTRAPVGVDGLSRAQLSAVPDHRRLGAALSSLFGQPLHQGAPLVRQWLLRVKRWRSSCTVVHQVEPHPIERWDTPTPSVGCGGCSQ